jgi:hypothetical protein
LTFCAPATAGQSGGVALDGWRGGPVVDQRLGTEAAGRAADTFVAALAPIVCPMRQEGLSLRAMADALQGKGIRTARDPAEYSGVLRDVVDDFAGIVVVDLPTLTQYQLGIDRWRLHAMPGTVNLRSGRSPKITRLVVGVHQFEKARDWTAVPVRCGHHFDHRHFVNISISARLGF